MADTAIRQELHALLDCIPDSDVPAARKILRALADPVEASLLTASVDDEPESDDERSAVAAALADPAPDVPFDQIRRVRA